MSARLLVAGTTSDAGKTLVVTALCRAWARQGIRVAPFKSQNMSNNSMVTADGAEIGRAQWVQALAAGAEPEAAMNPVLLKPGGDRASHVVVMGKPAGEIASTEFIGGRAHLAEAAYAAFDDLTARYDLVVAEGAGSPAEINLRAGDYVNMGLARHGDVPTIVVGDIDRGGVFAAFFGTLALLEPADQRLVTGFVVNKFRGDQTLLQPGLDELSARTDRRFYGVLPWSPDVWLDSEDALDLSGRRAGGGASKRVAVIRLPRISNFTDVDALGLEPGLDVEFVTDPSRLTGADLVVVPGTRSTISDLAWMRDRGLDRAVVAHAAAGRPVLGICGGCQILGREVVDADGVEADPGTRVDGLGLLDLTTTFTSDKVLRLPNGEALGASVHGYEIHHGRIEVGREPFLDGSRSGAVFGTMWHGSLESDDFRRAFLAETLGLEPSRVSFPAARETRLDLLGDLAEQHLDLDALLTLAHEGVA